MNGLKDLTRDSAKVDRARDTYRRTVHFHFFEPSILDFECSRVVRETLKGTNLIIYNADLSDSGDYICHAVNSAGEDMITVTLDVQTPAAIVTEDQIHTIVEGEPLEVSISQKL